jgi:hypothetical protein
MDINASLPSEKLKDLDAKTYYYYYSNCLFHFSGDMSRSLDAPGIW